ncbi:hypothetical protein G3I19_11345 [Streptomyces sp. SID10853]|uniref:hypothetical protein n=1 Tax=Streptomyces sp. SID10853 TaxID=2706028 RepID=UPI0013C0D1DB|nr:hypothetical protein [Streptomyces sp. SID10853]NDZ79100.1 hypothetical protein [Streptomyces sp. SID10853]
MTPSLLFLAIGSFTATKDLQKYFTTGNGPRVLMWFGIAGLAWALIQLALLLRAWRTTARQPLAEPQAVLRLRVFTAVGASATTGLLLFARYHGSPLNGDVAGSLAMLLAALQNLELYAGIALTILALAALIMIFPPGGLVLAGGGIVADAAGASSVAAVEAAGLGTAGVLLAVQGGDGSAGEGGPNGNKGGDTAEPDLVFKPSPKHGQTQRGTAAPEPTHPQETLENSISFNPNTTRRVGTDPETGEFAVFDETHNGTGIYHGHVRQWGELSQQMQSALRKAGRVTAKGKIK